MTSYVATIPTAAGPFTIVADDDAVLASGWTADPADLLPVIHPSLRPASVVERAELGEFTRAAAAYHDGDLKAIDGVPVRQASGRFPLPAARAPFLEHAWDVLRTVPAGEPVTYTKYAALAGRPAAVRAAASACARNAAALFVPCHRVLRTDGTLGGFRWGVQTKRWLLAHEAAESPETLFETI